MGDLSKSDAYASLLRFSHLSRVFQAGAHFSALDGQQLLGVEGSGWRGRRESDSQVFCHSNSVLALAFMDIWTTTTTTRLRQVCDLFFGKNCCE